MIRQMRLDISAALEEHKKGHDRAATYAMDRVETFALAVRKAALEEAARIVVDHETEHYKGIRPRDKYMAGEHLESIAAALRALAEGEKRNG